MKKRDKGQRIDVYSPNFLDVALRVELSYRRDFAICFYIPMTNQGVFSQTFGNRILGVMAWLMPLSVAISTFGSANGTLFAAGRLCFAASREGHLLDCLSYVHVRRFTPAPGLIFHSLVAGIKSKPSEQMRTNATE